MNRSLTGVVVIGVLGLGMFGLAAYLLGEHSPRLRVKIALEHEMHVKLQALEMATEPATNRVVLRLRVEPAGGTLTADEAGALAARAAAVIAKGEAPRLEYDLIEVLAPAGLAGAFDRVALERRAQIEARLGENVFALARVWGRPPQLRLVELPRPAPAAGVELGVALAERPPGPRTDAAIAADVLREVPFAAFVSIPAAEPSRPPAVVRRGAQN